MDKSLLRQSLSVSTRDRSFKELVSTLGFTPVANAIDYLEDEANETARRVGNAALSLKRVGQFETDRAKAGFWVAELEKWGDRHAERERSRRRIAKSLVELSPAGDRNVLVVLTASNTDDIELILPRRRSNGSLGTVRALVNRAEPTRYHLELLDSIEVKPEDSTVLISRKWANAFNVETVTKAFYLEFRSLRNRLVQSLQDSNPENPILNPGEDETGQSLLRSYVTRNLGRILFLWFIQCKGWLDNDTHFLQNLYSKRCRASVNHNFFRDSVIPLFFDAIARDPADRPQAAIDLGDLPYLNGGLFIQTAFEDRLYGEHREKVDIELPNELFDEREHDHNTPTVLGLLSSYRFTTRESTPDDQSIDPDPELLGKVFENLNEDRKKTGTYYTPREIVQFMCRKALDGYILAKTGVTQAVIDDLRMEAMDPSLTDRHLIEEERRKLQNALFGVRVCDPAVGSGAFPVGMLQEIITLLIGIEQSADVSVSIGGQRVAEWKEHIITHCLYGVDINPEAVEICHLRLWLSMVIDADRPMALPNLDFRFEAGDSLIDRVGEIGFPSSLPKPTISDLSLSEAFAGLHEIDRLREKYALCANPDEARELRVAIQEAEINAVKLIIDERLFESERARRQRQDELRERRKYGDHGKETKKIEAAVASHKDQIKALKHFRDHLSTEAPYKKPFFWPVAFPEIFEFGGFDVVVANPPYVRQEKLSPLDQSTYAAAFPEVHLGTADLLVYFFARAIHILKQNGWLSFITSNKFHRAGYGSNIRKFLPEKLTVKHVIDFGDLAVFDAIAYPCITIAKNYEPVSDNTTEVVRLAQVIRRELASAGMVENVTNVREILENLSTLLEQRAIRDYPQALLRRDGWILEHPELVRLFDRLKSMGTPLVEFVQGRMYRGVLTGFNEAFVINQATRDDLIAKDSRSADLIKPWLRGKDVKRWRPEWQGFYVIFTRRGTQISDYPAIKNYLSQWRKLLTPKKKSTDKGPGRKPGSYNWFEIQDNIAYFAEFETPKTVWATITPEPRFLWDENGFYTNQKCYVAPGIPKWAVAIMNSKLMFCLAAASSLVERQGGFHEWEKKYMTSLPIVTPDTKTITELERAVTVSVKDPGSADEQINDLVEELYEVSSIEEELIAEWANSRTTESTMEDSEDE